ncbi:hypothetical protein K7X08_037184 [Anisodus acutangulus]|uniref:Uncharacterized protein n=1 Tax=Anisodus acutangulus TaxID=402998 RepID=A0A9Q1MVX8_9SOLA|nr:hypothetical protein K7X08_037184 [Anisodus acutangulus]
MTRFLKFLLRQDLKGGMAKRGKGINCPPLSHLHATITHCPKCLRYVVEESSSLSTLGCLHTSWAKA